VDTNSGDFLMKAMSRRPLIGELWNSIQTWLSSAKRHQLK